MRVQIRCLALAIVGGLLGWVEPAVAQTDLTRLSIEDLLNTEVASVSRKEQTLSRTAAAVYVITAEDIRRSGARTVPDVIRLAPGFSVAQIDANSWAISARGFNGLFSNKLLVMIDGRSIYSHTFSGVFWEMQNLSLEEIDRVELVRGPGGSLWGANAVNGIINIITKRADETQGGLVTVGGGSDQRGLSEVRFGGRAGDGAFYRLSGRYSNRGSKPSSTGARPDLSEVAQFGGRYDWRSEIDTVAVTGSLQDGRLRHLVTPVTLGAPSAPGLRRDSFVEGNVRFSWTRSSSSRSETGLQTFYENYSRAQGDFEERWRIADIELRQRRTVGRLHELVYGAGYRVAHVEVHNSDALALANPNETRTLVSIFVQDEVAIGRNVRVTPGAKLERNDETGLEWQPSVRATWNPTHTQSIWAAFSRAVRTPSKIDRDLRVVSGFIPGAAQQQPMLLTVNGSPDFESEDVRSVEVGYRWQRGIASVDTAAFVSRYDDLGAPVAGQPYPGTFGTEAVLVFPLYISNTLGARSRGFELSGTLRPLPSLRMTGSYSQIGLRADATDGIPATSQIEQPVAQHQFQLRGYADLPARTELSAILFGASGIGSMGIDASHRADLRFAWRVRPRLELSVTAQNLLHNDVLEFRESTRVLESIPVKTSAFAGVTWRF